MLTLVYQAHPQQVLCLHHLPSQVPSQVTSQEFAALVEVARLVILLGDLQRLALLIDVRLTTLVETRLQGGVVVLGQGAAGLLVELVGGELLGEAA